MSNDGTIYQNEVFLLYLNDFLTYNTPEDFTELVF